MQLIKLPCSFFGKGCSESPDKIVSALPKLNEAGNSVVFSEDGVAGDGEAAVLDERIFVKAKSVFDSDSFSVFVGGDHGITYGIMKAFAKFENAGIVIFDAHPDCSSSFKTSHEDLVLALVNERIVKPENIILVGTRSWTKEELAFVKEKNIKYYSMQEISREGKDDVCDAVMSVAKNFGALYISIDMDVVDPAFAPGVSVAEAGGLSARELIYFIQRLKLLKNFKAADVCEVNIQKDNGMTVKLAGKVVGELC
jgi:agmatinase